ncbi:MAG: glycosyltransferase [Acidimicrobiales bacterium]|nr:glycosyltransferase [Acidimicrobiales bacterium]
MSAPPSPATPGGTPRHVVHLVRTDAFAGVERYVTYLAPELVRLGHDVTVIGGDPARMRAALAGTGVAHQPSGSFAHDVRALLDARPDVVHAHMTDAEVAAVAATARRRVPVVATLHFARPRGRDALRRTLWAPLPRRLDAQIAISRFVAGHAGQPGAEVLISGVPWTEPDAPREQVVLVAQRLEAEKDTATALRAWAASGLAADGWRMVVAGDGAQRTDLEAQAAALGPTGSVTFVGAVDDVPARLARAGIFLATATAEPLGLAVIEAMAAATPVVATAAGGHLETAGAAGLGHLFAPGDADAAGAELRRLAHDPEARAAHGAALHAHWAEHLTPARHAAAVAAVYRRVGA